MARQGQAEAAGPDAERVNEVFANTPRHLRPLRGDRTAVRSKVVMKVVAEPCGFREIKEVHLELPVEDAVACSVMLRPWAAGGKQRLKIGRDHVDKDDPVVRKLGLLEGVFGVS